MKVSRADGTTDTYFLGFLGRDNNITIFGYLRTKLKFWSKI